MNEEATKQYLLGYYGFGNPNAEYYFIGPEPGGKDMGTAEALEEAALRWAEGGCLEIEPGWPRTGAKSVPTWVRLIRILLSEKGETNISAKALREYQNSHLGSSKGETCLLELSPIQQANMGGWSLSDSPMEYLKSRKNLEEFCFAERAKRIQGMIQRHRPKAVLFYGLGYEKYWRSIADCEFSQHTICSQKAYEGHPQEPKMVMAFHPVHRGVTNAYLEGVGALLRTDRNVLSKRRQWSDFVDDYEEDKRGTPYR